MRVSCSEDDAGYRNFQAIGFGRIEVTLDHVVIRDAITADEEQGFVLRAARLPNGDLRLTAAGNEIATEELRGIVRVTIHDRDLADRT